MRKSLVTKLPWQESSDSKLLTLKLPWSVGSPFLGQKHGYSYNFKITNYLKHRFLIKVFILRTHLSILNSSAKILFFKHT